MHVEAALPQPSAGVDVLRIAQLRRADVAADEILGRLQSGILTDDERVAALRDRREDADLRALGAHVRVERGRGTDVSDVDGPGEQRLHGRRSGVERPPLELNPGGQGGLMAVLAFSLQLTGGERRRMRQVREEAHAERIRFGPRQDRRDQGGGETAEREEERRRTHGRKNQKALSCSSR